MREYLWLGDTGWPSTELEGPEDAAEPVDPTGEIDLDALSLHAPPPHLWDDLTPIEHRVIAEHYALEGNAEHSMSELHDELGLTRAEVRRILDSGLAKLRRRLTP
jgi:DNA-directed RNA polymerase sigma subunit (sigma70/sigma32)